MCEVTAMDSIPKQQSQRNGTPQARLDSTRIHRVKLCVTASYAVCQSDLAWT